MIVKPEMTSERITRYDLLPLSFLKKSAYTGSKGRLRYRIEREVIPLEQSNSVQPAGTDPVSTGSTGVTVGDKLVLPVQEQIVLRVSSWNGPNAYDLTPAEEISVKDFDFSEEALDRIIEYLNKLRES